MKSSFRIGELVYLVTDIEQQQRMITARCERQGGWQYELSFGTTSTWHRSMEISIEKDVLKTTTN